MPGTVDFQPDNFADRIQGSHCKTGRCSNTAKAWGDRSDKSDEFVMSEWCDNGRSLLSPLVT